MSEGPARSPLWRRVLANPLAIPAGLAEALILAPLRWLAAAYLTLRFVDERGRFPAIVLRRRSRLRITKAARARLAIPGRLIVESYMGQRTPAILFLGPSSTLTIEGPLTIGDDVRIRLEAGAVMRFGGARRESASGITARSVVLAHQDLSIGADTIISWETFITDSDGHSIGGRPFTKPTAIGEHVWIGAGVKVLRGARIGDGSIVAAGAVVPGGDYPAGSLLAGVPAAIVKKEMPEWRR